MRVCVCGWCARAAAPIAGCGIDKRHETRRRERRSLESTGSESRGVSLGSPSSSLFSSLLRGLLLQRLGVTADARDKASQKRQNAPGECDTTRPAEGLISHTGGADEPLAQGEVGGGGGEGVGSSFRRGFAWHTCGAHAPLPALCRCETVLVVQGRPAGLLRALLSARSVDVPLCEQSEGCLRTCLLLTAHTRNSRAWLPRVMGSGCSTSNRQGEENAFASA